MIHKFWNVRLAPSGQPLEPAVTDSDATDEQRNRVRDEEDIMEEKVYRIWSILSSFEESSAACISDMLLHVSNGAYIDGVLVAKRFISHVQILFAAIDQLAGYIRHQGLKGLSHFFDIGATNPYDRARLWARGKTALQKSCLFLCALVENQGNSR